MAKERYDIAVMKASLRGREHEIVTQFRGPHNLAMSTRDEMRWGTKGSFSLERTGKKAGLWYDHETQRGGDIFDLVKVETGGDFTDALEFLSSWTGIYPSSSAASVSPSAKPESDDDESPERITRAVEIFLQGQPIRGTLAERYLRSRYIEVPDEALEVLRFHPSCPWGQEKRPALVALVRDAITDEAIGIHRTALTADGHKIEKPRTLGPTGGGAIKFFSDGLISAELAIGEGIETTLSARMLGVTTPSWSVMNTGGMAAFPVLPHVTLLTLLIDNDANGAGQKAADACERRWRFAGKDVYRLMPKEAGDINDVLRREMSR